MHARLLAILFFVNSLASAQNLPAPHPDHPEPPDSSDTGWSSGRVRPFVAATVDAGFLYLRPRVSAGYGRPHSLWAGPEANPIFAGSATGGFVGVRAATPAIDLRLGVRTLYAFERNFLGAAPSYERLDLDRATGGQARYTTYEAELTGGVVAGPGELLGLASVSYVTGVPDGSYVFEETLRVIVAPRSSCARASATGSTSCPAWAR
jgi:hypothetical protein